MRHINQHVEPITLKRRLDNYRAMHYTEHDARTIAVREWAKASNLTLREAYQHLDNVLKNEVTQNV
jgi:hypothetical protein